MSGKISRIHIGGPQHCKVLKWFYSLTIETPLSEVHVLYRVAFQFVLVCLYVIVVFVLHYRCCFNCYLAPEPQLGC